MILVFVCNFPSQSTYFFSTLIILSYGALNTLYAKGENFDFMKFLSDYLLSRTLFSLDLVTMFFNLSLTLAITVHTSHQVYNWVPVMLGVVL